MTRREPKNVRNLIYMNGDAPRPSLIGRIARAVIGMPPAGARVPGVGDGRTTTNRKVKVTEQPYRHVRRHRR